MEIQTMEVEQPLVMQLPSQEVIETITTTTTTVITDMQDTEEDEEEEEGPTKKKTKTRRFGARPLSRKRKNPKKVTQPKKRARTAPSASPGQGMPNPDEEDSE